MATYDFAGKSVLISGAGGGLGLEAARRFGKAGARLILTDYDDKALKTVREMISSAGYQAVFLTGDTAEEATHKALVDLAVETHGRLDVALNNAGIAHEQKRLEDMGSTESRRVLEVDILGVVHAMRYQLPRMRQQFEETGEGGVILNTASVAGLVGAPTMSVYAAAKHAVVGLTRAAAIEYARKGIRVNALCPAFTRTNMVTLPLDASPHGRDKAESRLISNIPMARMGEVDEVVQAMLWACDPENSFYTGQTLALDGGLSAG